ncbi:hypothetical protein MAMMFC1_00087 [Methylomusa anaerophila]|uniref:Uncharacterized protein n=1 Tax=Methylomusa anaerophila TaxID=1930071 RepID=A0A348AEF6_9FIRM|nr:hypothetical protein MAMMFC1_00087 [Methylomusa anaerophila]
MIHCSLCDYYNFIITLLQHFVQHINLKSEVSDLPIINFILFFCEKVVLFNHQVVSAIYELHTAFGTTIIKEGNNRFLDGIEIS